MMREKEKLEKNAVRKEKGKAKEVTVSHGSLEMLNVTVREPDALGNHPQIPVDLEEGMAWGLVALSPCQFLTSEMQSRRSISGRFQRITQR